MRTATNNQAVFTLKGKPLNVWDLKRDIVYKNDEMYNLMRALDIEDNIEHLRYDKVILATPNSSNFITGQRRRGGDLGENVAEVFGAATFGARLHVFVIEQGLFGFSHPVTLPP